MASIIAASNTKINHQNALYVIITPNYTGLLLKKQVLYRKGGQAKNSKHAII